MENSNMIKKDNLNATGSLTIAIKDANGNVKQELTVPNLVVDTGLDFIAARMNGTSDAVMSHMAVGTGSTAAAAGDTALETQSAIEALTSATVTDNAIAFVATFAAGTGTGALTEAGIFNASSSGTMLCRTVFSVINKGASDSMTVTWTVTIS